MKILQLTNYPTANPMHGGQIRASQIAAALKKAGHVVESLAIYLASDFNDAADRDIAIDNNFADFPRELSFLSDYLTTCFIRSDDSIVVRVAAVVGDFHPDAIIVEQPWLFELAQSVAGDAVKLIYSSHNVEWRLKASLAQEQSPGAGQVEAVKALEFRAVANSVLVMACTTADARDLSAFALTAGATPPVIVCGNGVEPFSCDDDDVEQWSAYFSEVIGSPYPVFVSSGHLPNATGFWDMFAPGLSFLRPDEQVVVVGGVCSLIAHVEGIEAFREVNLSRLHLVGQRSKRELQAMVKAGHVVLLPITAGEGSNLKTAEALESGCAIVATTKAFRGYEDAMALPQVRIADTAPQFRRAVRNALSAPRNAIQTPADILARYRWDSQLAPLIDALRHWDAA